MSNYSPASIIYTSAGTEVSTSLLNGTTVAQTSVAASLTDTQILAASTTRLGATIWNNSIGNLWVSYGAYTASSGVCAVKLPADAYFEVPDHFVKLQVRGIWDIADGFARVAAVSP